MPHGGYHGTVMMGGNVIQQGGTGKDAGKLAPKDDKGQFIPFDTPLVNMPKKGSDRQPNLFAQTPADNLATIIDQKDILKFQPSPDRPGMNAYQDAIQNFRTSSPANMAAYAERFPLTQFAMTGLPKIATSMVPFGNVFSAIANSYQSGKGRIQGGVASVYDQLSGTFEGIRSLLPTSLGGENVPGEPSEFVAKKFVNESKKDDPDIFESNTSTDTPGVERIFKLPSDFRGDFNNMYFTGVRDPSLKENYLVNNPDLQSLIGMNLNQGGLASLNDPDYGMLMNASNFGF